MESREYHGAYAAVEFLWITLAPSVFLLHLFYLRPIGWTFEPLDSWLRSDFLLFFFFFLQHIMKPTQLQTLLSQDYWQFSK